MRIIDTTKEMFSSYTDGVFDIDKWCGYIDACVPGAKELCLADMREVLDAGYSWEDDYLPVLNAVPREKEKLSELLCSFRKITEHLDERIINRFGRSVDADIILYLGLCSGAGWVTPVNGRTTVLLGVEKILELNWQDPDNMYGLIVHELGHVYQSQYGVLTREFAENPDKLLWQLFTEGIAMVFEQEVCGTPDYFHQYDGEWLNWCTENEGRIKRAFNEDLKTMTPADQRYFGDWVSFEGHGDTGYYLGARFVRYLLESDSFDNIILYDMDRVKNGFDGFMASDESVVIRPMSKADHPSVAVIWRDVLDVPVSDEELERVYKQMENDDRYSTFVAAAGGKVVGLVTLAKVLAIGHPNGYTKVNGLGVLPEYQGKGIGRMLLNKAEDEARKNGTYYLGLASGIGRTDAHGFYESMGFKKTSYWFRKKLPRDGEE